ncbi:MAG: 3'(2'),5'-bisphosphate nucleotidase CysQ, partial [Pseudomonas sp.]|nr:3'(2'),5'-bisphosphate nucleotidase CysQ [Pseudomonas sp.]
MNDRELMQQVVQLTRQAGAAILPFWRADVAAQTKLDASPV